MTSGSSSRCRTEVRRSGNVGGAGTLNEIQATNPARFHRRGDASKYLT